MNFDYLFDKVRQYAIDGDCDDPDIKAACDEADRVITQAIVGDIIRAEIDAMGWPAEIPG